jgi:hypothetical protein
MSTILTSNKERPGQFRVNNPSITSHTISPPVAWGASPDIGKGRKRGQKQHVNSSDLLKTTTGRTGDPSEGT